MANHLHHPVNSIVSAECWLAWCTKTTYLAHYWFARYKNLRAFGAPSHFLKIMKTLYLLIGNVYCSVPSKILTTAKKPK